MVAEGTRAGIKDEKVGLEDKGALQQGDKVLDESMGSRDIAQQGLTSGLHEAVD